MFCLAEAHRGELHYTQTALEKELKAVDKNLELLLINGDWELYLVKFYGPTPSADLLIHQFTLEHEPGPWVIRRIQENNAINTEFGKLDSEETRRAVRRRLQSIVALNEIKREKRIEDIASEVREAIQHTLVKCKISTSGVRNRNKVRPGWRRLSGSRLRSNGMEVR